MAPDSFRVRMRLLVFSDIVVARGMGEKENEKRFRCTGSFVEKNFFFGGRIETQPVGLEAGRLELLLD